MAPSLYKFFLISLLIIFPTLGGAEENGIVSMELTFKKGALFSIMSTANSLLHRTITLEEYRDENQWQAAWMKIDNVSYPVSVRLLSKSPSSLHFDGVYQSMLVKVKHGQAIFGQTRFNLVLDKRVDESKKSGAGLFINTAKKLGLIYQDLIPVNISINGSSPRRFFFEAKIDKPGYMEWAGSPEYIINEDLLRNSDMPSRSLIYDSTYYPEFANVGLYNKIFDKSINRYKDISEMHKRAIYQKYLDFNRAIINSDNEIINFIDVDYIANYEAVRSIYGESGHGSSADNLTFFYNMTNGKFYPAFSRANFISKILEEKETLEASVNWYAATKRKISVFDALSKNNNIRAEKYKKIIELKNLLNNNNELMSGFEGVVAENIKYIMSKLNKYKLKLSSLTAGGVRVWVDKDSYAPMKIRGTNFQGFKSELVSVKEVASGKSKEYMANLIQNNKAAALFRLDNGEEVVFMNSLDENSRPVDTDYIITGERFEGFERVTFLNELNDYRVVTGIQDIIKSSADFKVQDYWRTMLMDKKIKIDHASRKIVFSAGYYKITSNIITPIGYDVEIQAGASIYLNAFVSMIFNGSLDIKGRDEAPVLISSTDTSMPFGVVAVHGHGKNERVTMNGLKLSFGSEAIVDGINHTGAFSIFNIIEAKITNSVFSNNLGDDALNLKRVTNFSIKGSRFDENYADSIDIDNSNGYILKTKILKSRVNDGYKAHNGDGLDVSGSLVLIDKLDVSGMGDKGISAGELSTIIFRNSDVKNCKIGVASKDSSLVIIGDNVKLQNVKNLMAYNKKSKFNGGLFLLKPGYQINGLNADEKSKLIYSSNIYKINASEFTLKSARLFRGILSDEVGLDYGRSPFSNHEAIYQNVR